MLGLVGWALFIVCGGCGLGALPISCIAGFIFRQRIMTAQEFVEIKESLRRRSEKMIEMGEQLLEAQDEGRLVSRKDVRLYKDYQKAVYDIEEKWKITRSQLHINSFVVLKPIMKLIFGLLL
jgi:hypothetical protein